MANKYNPRQITQFRWKTAKELEKLYEAGIWSNEVIETHDLSTKRLDILMKFDEDHGIANISAINSSDNTATFEYCGFYRYIKGSSGNISSVNLMKINDSSISLVDKFSIPSSYRYYVLPDKISGGSWSEVSPSATQLYNHRATIVTADGTFVLIGIDNTSDQKMTSALFNVRNYINIWIERQTGSVINKEIVLAYDSSTGTMTVLGNDGSIKNYVVTRWNYETVSEY